MDNSTHKTTQLLISTSSKLSDFTQKKAIFKRGTKEQDDFPNPLSFEEQEKLIISILSRCYSVKIDGQKEILLDLGDGKVQHIERNWKNFKTIIYMAFRDVLANKEYETINLPKLFEVIKSRDTYSFRESRSIFFENSKFVINHANKELISQIKINYEFQLSEVEQSTYDNIVFALKKHWRGHIDTIIEHMIAGQFATDKKSLWFLIMAKSNFGKSKIFKWIEPFGGSVFVNFEDIISGSGISDKKPEEFDNKLALCIDEAMSFPRSLFKIEDYLTIRPMRNHAINIPIGSRYLLSADGGTFNLDYMDKQISNRIAVIDLRDEETSELGDLEVTQKYGEFAISKVMEHYLYVELSKKLEEYRTLTPKQRGDKANTAIKNIMRKHKQKKQDFFERVNEALNEILYSPKDNLSYKVFNEVREELRIHTHKGISGYLISRPTTVLKQILIDYDKSLEYELKFKELSQIEKMCAFTRGKFKSYDEYNNPKTVSGTFIPKIELKEDTNNTEVEIKEQEHENQLKLEL